MQKALIDEKEKTVLICKTFTDMNDSELLTAAKKALTNYSMTKEGCATAQERSFTLKDLTLVPNNICESYGFAKIETVDIAGIADNENMIISSMLPAGYDIPGIVPAYLHYLSCEDADPKDLDQFFNGNVPDADNMEEAVFMTASEMDDEKLKELAEKWAKT